MLAYPPVTGCWSVFSVIMCRFYSILFRRHFIYNLCHTCWIGSGSCCFSFCGCTVQMFSSRRFVVFLSISLFSSVIDPLVIVFLYE